MAQTQQMALITVTVDDLPLGVFDTKSGGETTAEPTKRRSGGMGAQKSYAALPDHGDVTISRDYELERDHELMRRLRPRVGRARANISEQPLDENGAPWGDPITHIGRLTGLSPSELDSDSSDAQMFELTFQLTSIS
jgi:hypothetical protein